MPCGNYGATLSKAAYAEQKQDFLEQVRRKGIGPDRDSRVKRVKKSTLQQDEQAAQNEQLQMQMQLGMVDVLQHPDDVDDLHASLAAHDFPQDVTQDFYAQAHAYDPQLGHDDGSNNNLFEINPRAAIQQLQQLESAGREHDLAQALHDASQVYDQEGYTNDAGLDTSPQGEPYVPSMMTIDNLMNQQQHVMRAEQQRAAEEAAVRARKEETLAQQRRLHQAGQ